jgi:hypothetical protein
MMTLSILSKQDPITIAIDVDHWLHKLEIDVLARKITMELEPQFFTIVVDTWAKR